MSKKKLSPVSINYDEWLIASLHDPRDCELYLAEALKDEDPEMFLIALGNVLEAQTKGSNKTKKLSREVIDTLFTEKDVLVLQKLSKVFAAAGLNSLPFHENKISQEKPAKNQHAKKKNPPKVSKTPKSANYGEQVYPARISAKKRTSDS